MCKVYNSVGCLTAIKSHLHQHNISEFKSLNEVIAFQRGFAASRQQVILNAEIVIESEKSNLISENLQLKNSIESTKEAVKNELQEKIEFLKTRLIILTSATPKNTWEKIINYFKVFLLKKKIRIQKQTFQSRILQSVRQLMELYKKNEERHHYITSNFQDAVIRNCSEELIPMERKKALIDEVNSSIYGAIGEQKVVKELEKLPDDFILINDFCLSFTPPMYNRNENDYIQSIQADHILIAPSGVYLIETKNWSEQSLNNPSLRSPVSQIRRTSFALFNVLNNIERSGLNHHHWGKKKIAIKNLLVLINQKPQEEFQYVKILSLNQLLGYINYFPPIFTHSETEGIANELIRISGT